MAEKRKLLKEFEPGHGFSKEDWDAVSEDEDSTDEELATARPFKEAFPEIYEKMQEEKRARGRPPVEHPKVKVTIRLDQEVVERLRASGRGWQTRVNEILKKAV